jgi:hypothetical protein
MTVNTSPDLYFSLDGVISHTPGWAMFNTLDLAKPAQLRGTKPVIIPQLQGGLPMPLRDNPTERIIVGKVFGRLDQDGTPNASEIEGLQANLDVLVAAWGVVPVTADSTRTCVLHRLSGDLTGPVQVLDLDWDHQDMPIVANLIMRLLIPAGALA